MGGRVSGKKRREKKKKNLELFELLGGMEREHITSGGKRRNVSFTVRAVSARRRIRSTSLSSATLRKTLLLSFASIFARDASQGRAGNRGKAAIQFTIDCHLTALATPSPK